MIHLLRFTPRNSGGHAQGVVAGEPARAQELHPPPGGDGGAERAAGEDLLLDRLPAPEVAQELEEAGRLAGVHGEEPLRVGRQGGLDFGPREAEAGELLKEAAQAGVGPVPSRQRAASSDGLCEPRARLRPRS